MIRTNTRTIRTGALKQAGTCAFLLVLLAPLPALAAQQLVVVRKSGQATSYASQGEIGDTAKAACVDQSVAFAFIAE
ncbi:MAG: hypothetical protein ABI650_07320, partial [Dokdonella sp.]